MSAAHVFEIPPALEATAEKAAIESATATVDLKIAEAEAAKQKLMEQLRSNSPAGAGKIGRVFATPSSMNLSVSAGKVARVSSKKGTTDLSADAPAFQTADEHAKSTALAAVRGINERLSNYRMERHDLVTKVHSEAAAVLELDERIHDETELLHQMRSLNAKLDSADEYEAVKYRSDGLVTITPQKIERQQEVVESLQQSRTFLVTSLHTSSPVYDEGVPVTLLYLETMKRFSMAVSLSAQAEVG